MHVILIQLYHQVYITFGGVRYMDERFLECKDGHRLFYRVWKPEASTSPKAVLHLLHGMAEHSYRYNAFAKYLNTLGFIVYAQDHRGHGNTKEEDEKGWFAEKNGWALISSDSWELDVQIMRDCPDMPLMLMGHSMGSFLARTMIVKHPDAYSAVVISGTGGPKGLAGKLGIMIAKSHVKKFGGKMPDQKMDKLCFGSFNKRISNPKTPFDWLSRDPDQVRKYIKDPQCGFVCSSAFFVDLLTGMEFANSKDNAKRVSKHLPMLIISGDKDPVGDYGSGVTKVYNLYRNAGVSDVTLHLVPDARHELLNETNRSETIRYISDWLVSHLR